MNDGNILNRFTLLGIVGMLFLVIGGTVLYRTNLPADTAAGVVPKVRG